MVITCHIYYVPFISVDNFALCLSYNFLFLYIPINPTGQDKFIKKVEVHFYLKFLQLGDTLDFDQKVRKRKTLNLHNSA